MTSNVALFYIQCILCVNIYYVMNNCRISMPMPEDAHRMSETLQIQLRDVLPTLSNEEKKVVRVLESTKKKITNAHFAVIFNQTCIYIHIHTYIYIYIYIYICS